MSEHEPMPKTVLSRIPRGLRGALFYLVQFTWGLPQNLLGLALLLALGRQERTRFHGARITAYRNSALLRERGAFSLGMFIFMDGAWSEATRAALAVHEYGHTVQSLLTGPLYLLLVGLPSAVWAGRYARNTAAYRERGITYASRYPERGADRLGAFAVRVLGGGTSA